MELLAEVGADLLWDIGKSWQIPQMLLTLEEGEQRQLLALSPRMGHDKRSLIVSRTVEGMQFGGGEGRFETRIGGAFDGCHRGQAPREVSEKGYAVRPKTAIVL